MAERPDASKRWPSRCSASANLPRGVVQVFGSPHVIGIKRAALLVPPLHVPAARLLKTAMALVLRQAPYVDRDAAAIRPAPVVRRTMDDTKRRSPSHPTMRPFTRSASDQVRGENGALVASAERPRNGAPTLRIPSPGRTGRDAVLAALVDVLNPFVNPRGRESSASERTTTTDADSTPSPHRRPGATRPCDAEAAEQGRPARHMLKMQARSAGPPG